MGCFMALGQSSGDVCGIIQNQAGAPATDFPRQRNLAVSRFLGQIAAITALFGVLSRDTRAVSMAGGRT
jgi:hypothetical protein